MSSTEQPLRSDTTHVDISDDENESKTQKNPYEELPFIHPYDTRKISTGPIHKLPLFEEMDELRQQHNLKDNPEELDAILSGTLLEFDEDGLSEDERRIVRNKIRDLRKMSMSDLLEYVALCTFN